MNMTLRGSQVAKAAEFVIDFMEYKPHILSIDEGKEVTTLELLAILPKVAQVKVIQQRFLVVLAFGDFIIVEFKLSKKLRSKVFWSYFVEYVKEAV